MSREDTFQALDEDDLVQGSKPEKGAWRTMGGVTGMLATFGAIALAMAQLHPTGRAATRNPIRVAQDVLRQQGHEGHVMRLYSNFPLLEGQVMEVIEAAEQPNIGLQERERLLSVLRELESDLMVLLIGSGDFAEFDPKFVEDIKMLHSDARTCINDLESKNVPTEEGPNERLAHRES